MKKIYLFLIGVLGFTFLCNAQYVTLYTPNGSPVQTFIRSEGSTEWITTTTNEYKAAYGEENVLAPASQRYNCHNYAWHMSEGNPEIVWMNQYDSYGNSNVWKYWTDNSYVETTENNAEKIFYYNGDHSAIKSKTIAGKYESKWGSAPLMRHAPTYGPAIYQMNFRRYYTRSLPSLTGPTTVCSTGATFTINNLSASVSSIIWTHGPNLSISSGQNSANCTFLATGNGASWVRANLVTDCGDMEIPRQNVYAGVPNPNDIGFINVGPYYPTNNVLCTDIPNDGIAQWNSFGTVLEYDWAADNWLVVPHPMDILQEIPMQNVQIIAASGYNSSLYINIRARNQCGWGNYKAPALSFTTTRCRAMVMSLTPNPSFGTVIVKLDAEFKLGLNFLTGWKLEVRDQSQRLITRNSNIRSNEFTLNTSGWEKGVYIATVSINNVTFSEKLIVR